MRTFIAIELPQEIKDFFKGIQDQLKSSQADVKWVEPKNIHLTLKFLGEIDERKIDEVIEVARGLAKENKLFYIRLSSVGAFPNANYPRVIWIGIDKGDAQVKQIASLLEEGLSRVGLPKEKRPFSSHITIGRVRSGLNRKNLTDALSNVALNFNQASLEFPVEKIILFKSTLTPGGPIYEALHSANLKTA